MHNSEKYDGLATEELEKILRSNMENTADLKTDEELLSISEILVLRKQDSDCPGKTAKEGWKSFRKNYSPYKPAKLTPRACRWMAVAMIVVILTTIPLTVRGVDWKGVYNAVAKWAEGTFFFSGNTPVENLPNTPLQDILVEAGMPTDIVPTWLPDGYILEKTKLDETPMQTNCLVLYKSGDKTITISVRSYIEGDSEKFEVNENLIEIYRVSEVDYYIFSNNQRLQAMWSVDKYECSISGKLTVDEMKQMIDSIGK